MLLGKANLAIWDGASAERGRYSLNGILIEPDGTTVAADGCQLIAVAPCREDKFPLPHVGTGGARVILNRDDVKAALASLPKRAAPHAPGADCIAITQYKPLVPARLCNGTVELTAVSVNGATTTSAEPLAGQFPQYKSIIPSRLSNPPAVTFTVGLARLAKLAATLKRAVGRISSDEDVPVTIEVHGPRKAVVLRVNEPDRGADILALLMPVIRADNSPEPADDFRAALTGD